MTSPASVLPRGLRFYPDSVKVIGEAHCPIFVHGSMDTKRSDFEVLFGPLFSRWESCMLLDSFVREILDDGSYADPSDELHRMYGEPSVHSFDLQSGLVLTFGSGVPSWAPFGDAHGLLLFVLTSVVPISELASFYWGDGHRIARGEWPPELKCLVQNWDGIFWQFFSRDQDDLSTLLRSHRSNERIRTFEVTLSKEYPNPSGEPLRQV